MKNKLIKKECMMCGKQIKKQTRMIHFCSVKCVSRWAEMETEAYHWCNHFGEWTEEECEHEQCNEEDCYE